MAGEIISIVAQASSQPGWVDSPVMSSVSGSDAARMSDLMSNPALQAPAQAAPPAPAAAVTPASEVRQAANSMGDKILNAWDSVGRQYNEGAARIDKMISVDAGTLTMSDALRLQVEFFRTSMQIDMMGKCVSKSGQHLDTLTKLQ